MNKRLTAAPALAPAFHRNGELQLDFERVHGGRTIIRRQYSSYPFHVCRPFYLDDGKLRGMASIYTQSCAGGLYTEDCLHSDFHIREDSAVHITSQASTIVHRGTRGPASQRVDIKVQSGAYVEYMPDPMILLAGAHLQSSLQLTVDETASVVMLDSFLAHDPQGLDERFERFDNEVIIQNAAGAPLAIDRFSISGERFASGNLASMGRYRCHASLMVYSNRADLPGLIDGCRRILANSDACLGGVSELPDQCGVGIRVLATHGAALKSATLACWADIRTQLTASRAVLRKK